MFSRFVSVAMLVSRQRSNLAGNEPCPLLGKVRMRSQTFSLPRAKEKFRSEVRMYEFTQWQKFKWIFFFQCEIRMNFASVFRVYGISAWRCFILFYFILFYFLFFCRGESVLILWDAAPRINDFKRWLQLLKAVFKFIERFCQPLVKLACRWPYGDTDIFYIYRLK